MKKLPSQPQDMFRKLNELIDLVNSQQEAIEKLQEHVDHEAMHVSEPADDKPEYSFDKFAQGAKEYVEKNDTHRTVTLRIPKGMTIGDIMWRAFTADSTTPYAFGEWLALLSDTDLQKALDEVEHE